MTGADATGMNPTAAIFVARGQGETAAATPIGSRDKRGQSITENIRRKVNVQ